MGAGGLILLYVAGALKHALIDRDHAGAHGGGNPPACEPPAHPLPLGLRHALAAIAAVAIWATAAIPAQMGDSAQPQGGGDHARCRLGLAVRQGTLAISVKQGGNDVSGQFGQWQAKIDYAPETQTGAVDVTIGIASLTLGAVGDSARAGFPERRRIRPPASGGDPARRRGRPPYRPRHADRRRNRSRDRPGALSAGPARRYRQSGGPDHRRPARFRIGARCADERPWAAVAISFDLTAKRRQ